MMTKWYNIRNQLCQIQKSGQQNYFTFADKQKRINFRMIFPNRVSHIITRNAAMQIKYFFSKERKKVEEVGFRRDEIVDTIKLTYYPEEKIKFQNGRCLLYESKKGFFTSLKRYAIYYTSIGSVGYFIYANPCNFQPIQSLSCFSSSYSNSVGIADLSYDSFNILVVKMMFKRYQWNQRIAHRIFLLESGSTTEIQFADGTRRKYFGEPATGTYYNTIFSDPDDRQKQEVMPNTNTFPTTGEDFEKFTLGSSWCKYFSNGQNYILIPKSYSFMRKDVLVELFKGKSIKNK